MPINSSGLNEVSASEVMGSVEVLEAKTTQGLTLLERVE